MIQDCVCSAIEKGHPGGSRGQNRTPITNFTIFFFFLILGKEDKE